jgi:hypothetical protein
MDCIRWCSLSFVRARECLLMRPHWFVHARLFKFVLVQFRSLYVYARLNRGLETGSNSGMLIFLSAAALI